MDLNILTPLVPLVVKRVEDSLVEACTKMKMLKNIVEHCSKTKRTWHTQHIARVSCRVICSCFYPRITWEAFPQLNIPRTFSEPTEGVLDKMWLLRVGACVGCAVGQSQSFCQLQLQFWVKTGCTTQTWDRFMGLSSKFERRICLGIVIPEDERSTSELC